MAVSGFMKIEGVTGQVNAKGFEGQIAVESFQWAVGRAVSTPTSGAARETSVPSFSSVSCMKVLDSSSMAIARFATYGEAIPEVIITLVREKAGGELEPYLIVTLGNVLVESHSLSFSAGGDTPMESFALNYLTVKMKLTWPATDYTTGGDDDYSWDLSAMTTM